MYNILSDIENILYLCQIKKQFNITSECELIKCVKQIIDFSYNITELENIILNNYKYSAADDKYFYYLGKFLIDCSPKLNGFIYNIDDSVHIITSNNIRITKKYNINVGNENKLNNISIIPFLKILYYLYFNKDQCSINWHQKVNATQYQKKCFDMINGIISDINFINKYFHPLEKIKQIFIIFSNNANIMQFYQINKTNNILENYKKCRNYFYNYNLQNDRSMMEFRPFIIMRIFELCYSIFNYSGDFNDKIKECINDKNILLRYMLTFWYIMIIKYLFFKSKNTDKYYTLLGEYFKNGISSIN